MDINLFLTMANINVIECLSKIDKCGYGILYVVDFSGKLIGCVSDGDIRRWIIKTNDLTASVTAFMNTNPKFVYEDKKDAVDEFKNKCLINSLPVLNRNNEIVDIIILGRKGNESVKKTNNILFTAPVIVMAGGKGTRLYPYTKILPKPLIPIGDTPILERIFDKFQEYGICKFYLTVNYKKSMIKSYFNEIDHSYEIIYIEEDEPLGTAGSIKLIKESFKEPIIVANCDQIINADYKDLYEYHKKSGNIITIVSALKNFKVPYGVLKTKENGEVVQMEEKPTISYFVNTGMYVVNPEVISLIPDHKMFHMTQLIETAQKNGKQVGIYPVSEDSFLDMGEFGEMKRMEEKLNVFGDE